MKEIQQIISTYNNYRESGKRAALATVVKEAEALSAAWDAYKTGFAGAMEKGRPLNMLFEEEEEKTDVNISPSRA